MKLPLSLIKSFIPLDRSPSEISNALTLLGLEVDRIINEQPSFSNVIACHILSVDPHPNAKKLQVAQVSDGNQTFQVVCGALNCRAHIKTAFAKEGATLSDTNGHKRMVEHSTIRGVPSSGMLCSGAELGLSAHAEGILELDDEIPIGQDLASLFWDPIFEISLTPNLGHCMSALGVARELSALFMLPLTLPSISLKTNASIHIKEKIRIEIAEQNLVPKYMCRLIQGISIAPSPQWLQRQLVSCGLTPICNAVDAANYILFKTGQPLHVFDYDRIQGNTLKIALSETPCSFLGLDGVERQIPQKSLLISDKTHPLVIAGILGGKDSAVSDQTRNILIEAAIFDAKTIRASMKQLSLRTDSAQRFEKGVDPNETANALDEACALLLKLCGGTLAEGVLDIASHSTHPKQIKLRAKRVDHLLGKHFSLTELTELLQRLKFSVQAIDDQILQVTVPSFRMDISEEIDLIEEIARLYGYNNFEIKSIACINTNIPHDPLFLFEQNLREHLVRFGLQEFLTSDLISPQLASIAQEWVQEHASLLKALYAKTEDHSILRPSLFPGLAQAAKTNFNHRTISFGAFEIGNIHLLEHEKLIELPMAAIVLTGKFQSPHWSRKPVDVDFFDIKGLIENLFQGMFITHNGALPSFLPSSHASFHPGRQAEIICQERTIGFIGEIHPALLNTLDIKQRLFYAELNILHMMHLQQQKHHMHPITQFPSSERDWTLPLPLTTPIQTVFTAIYSSHNPFLANVELIDLYQPQGQLIKNATFRFTYRDPLKTTSFEEVEAQHQQLTEQVLKLLAK